jgi:A/G-specific adenine glycosylase
MLQQTQVATVIPYYQKFLKSFPTVYHLARADLSRVLKVWEGLGYYSRARNLHRASKIIVNPVRNSSGALNPAAEQRGTISNGVNHFSGKIPDNLKDLLRLPGIGRSTAGAILSFAYNKEAPLLDGNAKRVLSRLFAVSKNPVGDKTERLLWQISESLIPRGRSNPFNQALMDLGSMICTPKDLQCPHCPLRNLCKGYLSGKPESYPPRTIKKRIPHITGVSAVIEKDGKVLLRQRPEGGLLGGLWEFPNWKTEGKKRLRLRLRDYIKKETGMNVEVKESIGMFHQTYSHFKLTLQVFYCQSLDRRGRGKWIPVQKLHLLPMSKIHRRIAEAITSLPSTES